jgi:protein tyrosine phosphatase
MQLDNFFDLVRYFYREPTKTPYIHCASGVGRTGLYLISILEVNEISVFMTPKFHSLRVYYYEYNPV